MKDALTPAIREALTMFALASLSADKDSGDLKEAMTNVVRVIRNDEVEACFQQCKGELDNHPANEWDDGFNAGVRAAASAIRNRLNNQKVPR